MKLTNHKDGESMTVAGILPLAIVFVILAVTISLGADVLDDIRDTTDNKVNALTTNESPTWAGNNSPITLANNELGIVSGTFILYNNGTVVNQGANYTVDYPGATFTPINISPNGDLEWVTGQLNVTYSYYYGSTARNASVYGLTTQNTFARWTPTIALVIMVAIILGIILTYLYRNYSQ